MYIYIPTTILLTFPYSLKAIGNIQRFIYEQVVNFQVSTFVSQSVFLYDFPIGIGERVILYIYIYIYIYIYVYTHHQLSIQATVA